MRICLNLQTAVNFGAYSKSHASHIHIPLHSSVIAHISSVLVLHIFA